MNLSLVEEFLTTGICTKCGHCDSYEAVAISDDNAFIVENCFKCRAEGQFFITILEVK